ncbi:MAG: SseB family protein [Paracoccaceae bacterium]
MTETTPLDLAHMALEDQGDGEAALRRFYERIAASELVVLLEEGDAAEPHPQVFRLSEGAFVTAFDREDRLSAFADAPAHFAALPGRELVRALAGRGVGIGINLGVAPSSFLMGPEAVDWLAAMLPEAPVAASLPLGGFLPPEGLTDALIAGLDARFAAAAGLAARAGVAGVVHGDGRTGLIVAFFDAVPEAEAALAQGVAEAAAFAGGAGDGTDVVFLRGRDPAAAAFGRVGLIFAIPEATGADAAPPSAPGTDPAMPPRLR